MRELALHILDLVENATRAGASIVAVTVAADATNDVLRLVIEDNGGGLCVAPEAAADPFYTTKPGKRTGLGLSLLLGAAEATGGRVIFGRSELGGLAVAAEFGLTHVDRNPLGNLAETLTGVVATNPGVDLRVRVQDGARDFRLSSAKLAEALGGPGGNSLVLARSFGALLQAELEHAEALH